MSSSTLQHVQGLARQVAALQAELRDLGAQVAQVATVASPEQAAALKQLVHQARVEVCAVDEKLVAHAKGMDRHREQAERQLREDLDVRLKREKLLLETILTQKMEQTFLKLVNDKLEGVRAEVAAQQRATEARLQELGEAVRGAMAVAEQAAAAAAAAAGAATEEEGEEGSAAGSGAAGSGAEAEAEVCEDEPQAEPETEPDDVLEDAEPYPEDFEAEAEDGCAICEAADACAEEAEEEAEPTLTL
jgi:hypothetical protein